MSEDKIRRKHKPSRERKPNNCRYCKRDGHLIKDCPTRPQRHQSIPVEKTKPSEMYWPPLGNDTYARPELQGDWADGSLVDTIISPSGEM